MAIFLIIDLESILLMAYVLYSFFPKLLFLITKLLETHGNEGDFLLLLTDFKANMKHGLTIFCIIFSYFFLRWWQVKSDAYWIYRLITPDTPRDNFLKSPTSFLLSFAYEFSSHGKGEWKNLVLVSEANVVEADAVLASTQSFASTSVSSLITAPHFISFLRLSLSQNYRGKLCSLPSVIYKLKGALTKISDAWDQHQ